MSGRVKAQVIDKQGKVVKDFPWQRNLILNSGMNEMAARALNNCWKFAVIGTGNSANKHSSGAITASQSGTTVTFSASFTNLSVGTTLKWDTGGEIAMVTTVTSSTSVEVDRSQTVSANTFASYRTEKTALDSESKRADVFGTGDNGTTYDNATRTATYRREWEFAEEVANVNYNEVGFSWNTSTANLFSRIVLASTISMLTGQKLRLKYELDVVVGPAPGASTWNVSGWANSSGTWGAEGFGIIAVRSDGITNTGSTAQTFTASHEPASMLETVLSNGTNAIAFPASGQHTGDDGATAGLEASSNVPATYVVNSFKRSTTSTFDTGTSLASVSSIRIHAEFIRDWALRYLFSTANTKEDTHKLTLTYELTWDRVLN